MPFVFCQILKGFSRVKNPWNNFFFFLNFKRTYKLTYKHHKVMSRAVNKIVQCLFSALFRLWDLGQMAWHNLPPKGYMFLPSKTLAVSEASTEYVSWLMLTPELVCEILVCTTQNHFNDCDNQYWLSYASSIGSV